jgi:hypothetical protein
MDPHTHTHMYMFLDAGSVSSAASVSSLVSLTSGNRRNKILAKSKKSDDAMYNTLLHRKLRKYENC